MQNTRKRLGNAVYEVGVCMADRMQVMYLLHVHVAKKIRLLYNDCSTSFIITKVKSMSDDL